jgi:hypothetical protein
VYEQALAQGEPPRLAVAKHFDVPTWTASKYIARARSSGFLAPYRINRKRCRAYAKRVRRS